MRIPRLFLKVDDEDQVFHLISRVANKQFLLNHKAKLVFIHFLRRYEAFSGCQVLTFCLMDNHFHLLLKVPKRPERISCEEVERRLTHVMSDTKMQAFRSKIELLSSSPDKTELELYLNAFRKRMFELSFFMKDLKQRFTQWYNHEFDHEGTLWESRFTGVLVSNSSHALLKVASYIDLNPVRAGMVEDPVNYRWGIFGENENGPADLTNLSECVGKIDYSDWKGIAVPDFAKKYYHHLKLIIGLDRDGDLPAGEAFEAESQKNEMKEADCKNGDSGKREIDGECSDTKKENPLIRSGGAGEPISITYLAEYTGFSKRKQSYLYRQQYNE